MANEGHIFVKKAENERPPAAKGRWAMKQFYGEVDKGSAKPAFCYPKRAQSFKEELESMEKAVAEGRVDPERKMAYELQVKEHRARVDQINDSFENAKEIIDKNPDAWKSRRENLAKEIAERTPTADAVRKRRVNPHSVLRSEKQGSSGKRPLEDLKREYTIISRAFQARGDYEEANHSYLQKDE
jgi:hypothetical protein